MLEKYDYLAVFRFRKKRMTMIKTVLMVIIKAKQEKELMS